MPAQALVGGHTAEGVDIGGRILVPFRLQLGVQADFIQSFILFEQIVVVAHIGIGDGEGIFQVVLVHQVAVFFPQLRIQFGRVGSFVAALFAEHPACHHGHAVQVAFAQEEIGPVSCDIFAINDHRTVGGSVYGVNGFSRNGAQLFQSSVPADAQRIQQLQTSFFVIRQSG